MQSLNEVLNSTERGDYRLLPRKFPNWFFERSVVCVCFERKKEKIKAINEEKIRVKTIDRA